MTDRGRGASLANIEVFCRTFELGNFTLAATDLGITPQAASRAIARLERHLGARLFRRTTRRLEPSDAARAYYERCRQALDLLATSERDVVDTEPAERGIVRISVGNPWGHHRLAPALARFSLAHPMIELVVQIDHRNIDFVRDGFDCAIRVGPVRQPGLIARTLGVHRLGIYASPSYLARKPAPATFEELAHHRCIGFVMPGTGRVLPWLLGAGVERAPSTALRVHGDPLGAVALARAGAGLIQTYRFAVEREVARGELVEVLAGTGEASRSFALLYPKDIRHGAAARRLIAYLVEDAKRSA